MNTGDNIIVIRSPYNCIKNGTTAKIIDIKFKAFPKRWHMYILDTNPCNTFREHEITPGLSINKLR